MKLRLFLLLAASACLGSMAARAEELAPRDIWPQATAAADSGNADAAAKKTSQLTEAGKSLGIRTYPVYAISASALSRQAAKQGNKSAAEWGAKAADALDPVSPAVAFMRADDAADSKNFASALTNIFRGFANILRNYRSRLLSRSDFLITILLAIALTAN